MAIFLDCSTAAASPDLIKLPGCSTLTVSVRCLAATTLSVTYVLTGATVTFADGSKQSGPFTQPAPAGTSAISRNLCFAPAAGVALFVVEIHVTEIATGQETLCLVNIGVL